MYFLPIWCMGLIVTPFGCWFSTWFSHFWRLFTLLSDVPFLSFHVIGIYLKGRGKGEALSAELIYPYRSIPSNDCLHKGFLLSVTEALTPLQRAFPVGPPSLFSESKGLILWLPSVAIYTEVHMSGGHDPCKLWPCTRFGLTTVSICYHGCIPWC